MKAKKKQMQKKRNAKSMFIINKIIKSDPPSHDQHESSISYLYIKFLYKRSGAEESNEKIERKNDEKSDEKKFFYKNEKKNIAM